MRRLLRLVSLLDPLIERLQHAGVHRGDHIHSGIQLFFAYPRFPCVRKASIHSRVAQPHHCNGEADEHLLALGEALDCVGITIECSKVWFFQFPSSSDLS